MPRVSKAQRALEKHEKAYADFTSNPMFGLVLLECDAAARAATGDLAYANTQLAIGERQGYAKAMRDLQRIVASAYSTELARLRSEEIRSGDDEVAPEGDTANATARQRNGVGDGGEAHSYERARGSIERFGTSRPGHAR